MNPLKCVVIGTGHLGKVHTRLIQQLGDAELVAVVDPDPAARAAVASACGVEAVADLSAVDGRIDAAIVAAPTQHHHSIALDLLSRGVPCLVEKPITQTVAEAEQLIHAAARTSTVLAVGHVERFNPAVAAAAPYVNDPKYITANRSGPYTFRSTDVSVVLDLMIHDLDIVLSFVQSPIVDVSALGAAVFGPHEDMAQARLTFANGCIADIVASRTSPQPARQMQVFSQTGYADIDFASRTCTVIEPSASIRNGEIDVHALTPDRREEIKENLFQSVLPLTEITPSEANPLLDEQRNFLESIRAGRPARVTGEQARDALAAATHVLNSIAAHRWDATPEGRIGPHFKVTPHVLKGPHWHRQPAVANAPHRKAG
jgi:predicted dehydrogenase